MIGIFVCSGLIHLEMTCCIFEMYLNQFNKNRTKWYPILIFNEDLTYICCLFFAFDL